MNLQAVPSDKTLSELAQVMPQNKYSQLLQVIDEMGRDIKPTYAGNKMAAERLKKNIHTARLLVRECLLDCERQARNQ